MVKQKRRETFLLGSTLLKHNVPMTFLFSRPLPATATKASNDIVDATCVAHAEEKAPKAVSIGNHTKSQCFKRTFADNRVLYAMYEVNDPTYIYNTALHKVVYLG